MGLLVHRQIMRAIRIAIHAASLVDTNAAARIITSCHCHWAGQLLGIDGVSEKMEWAMGYGGSWLAELFRNNPIVSHFRVSS